MIKIGLISGGVITVDERTVDVSALKLTDIARGLSNITRFSGQLDRPYSVAEHSVILSEITEGYDAKISALFHDAAETLGIGDVNTFLKPKQLKAIEKRILDAVYAKFGIEEFKGAELDQRLGAYEACTIHPAKGQFPKVDRPGGVVFRHWSSGDAADKWLQWLVIYQNSKEFAKHPFPVAGLRPNVPFDLRELEVRYPGVLPSAVAEAVEKNLTIVKLREGQYVWRG